MPASALPRWLLTISGTERRCGTVSLVFELGESLATVLDVEIAEPIVASPGPRTPVTLRYADRDTEVSYPVFSGHVQEPLSTSDPNRVVIRCAGPLALLRDTWDSDTDVTGDTDGEVVEAALTASGITYSAANIQDAGLLLGAIEDVIAPYRQRRDTIVRDLNRLLGMALIDQGGTVRRFAYDLVPSAANIVRTFERGVDVDFWGNERRRGPLDEIRNNWTVTGLSFPCGTGDSCRCNVWATAAGPNSSLGGGVRTEPSPESSDLIQTSAFAAAIATRLMRWYNRSQDRITIKAPFDPDVLVGMTVGVRDPIAGVHLTDPADETPYLVTRIEVLDFQMTLSCVGGAAGGTGTVASGTDKQCNETTTPGGGPGAPGGFDPPEAGGPPAPPSDPWDPCLNTWDPYLCDTTEDANHIANPLAGAGYYTYADLTSIDWRATGGIFGGVLLFHTSANEATPPGEAVIDEIIKYGGAASLLYYNTTTPKAAKTAANDFNFGTAPVVAVSFDVRFDREAASIVVWPYTPGAAISGFAVISSLPGAVYNVFDDTFYGIALNSEYDQAKKVGSAAEHTCPHITLNCNNGGFRAAGGLPLNTWMPVTIVFDYSSWPYRVTWVDSDSGQMISTEFWGPDGQFAIAEQTCAHSFHGLLIQMNNATGATLETPVSRIRELAIGTAGCAANPNYDPETTKPAFCE